MLEASQDCAFIVAERGARSGLSAITCTIGQDFRKVSNLFVFTSATITSHPILLHRPSHTVPTSITQVVAALETAQRQYARIAHPTELKKPRLY